MIDAQGKTAVVTGAGGGIGRGIALALAARRCNVFIGDIDVSKARAVADEINASGGRAAAVCCDISQRASVQAMADSAWDTFGSVDLLFNNAGIFIMGPGLDASEADLRWLFDVNVIGTWNCTSIFGRRFIEQKIAGWICCTASDTAIGMSNAGLAVYGSTKHALLGMYDVLQHDYAGKIGFSVVCPGAVNTEIWNTARYRPVGTDASAAGGAFARRAVERGVDPLWIGELAVAGVCREEFLIITHPYIADLARARCAAVTQAVERQWPAGATEAHRISQAEIGKLAQAG